MVNQQTIGDSTSHLSADDLAALRENLHEQRLFRQEQLRRLTGPVTSRAESRLRERAASQTEVQVQLAASARMVLTDVEAALARMNEGGYGACRLCGGPIDRERLMIVPQARYCAPLPTGEGGGPVTGAPDPRTVEDRHGHRPWPRCPLCCGLALDLGSARTRAWISGRGVVVHVPSVPRRDAGAPYPAGPGIRGEPLGSAGTLRQLLGPHLPRSTR